MPVRKRGSMNLEYVISSGADVRDESIITHNSFNSYIFVKH